MKGVLVKDLRVMEGCIDIIGDEERWVDQVVSFNVENSSDSTLMWISQKNADQLSLVEKGVVITPVIPERTESNVVYILVLNPRRFFSKVLFAYFVKKEEISISSSARISPTAQIGANVFIGENVVIEDNVTIGEGSRIGHNTVIKSDTVIGSNVIIGSNTTIGGIGFGYEKDEEGRFIQIPHIGNVVLSDNVEIGNNTCIDKAVLGSTFLSKYVKVDNLVHIAHGVQIGENSLIIANSMVAGSTTIGSNVWVAPSSSILNKKVVGDNSIIGMAAVVLKDVAEGDIVVGMPAKSIKR